MSELKIEEEIENILNKVAELQAIENYKIDFDKNAIRGDGFLGEFFMGSIKNTDTDETLALAIKKAFKNEKRREMVNLDVAYHNEVYFYSQVFPTLDAFQREKGITELFCNIPRFFYGTIEPINETIVLENIKTLGYVLRNKEDLLDDEHARLIFKTYGKYHALSYAFKDQKPEEYGKLCSGMKNFMKLLAFKEEFCNHLNAICNTCFNLIDSQNEKLIEDCQEYFNDGGSIFRNVSQYKGKCGVINHGDCWSNNMMFKYSETEKLENMKLFDFQLIIEGTPVYDLSYFFYAGGTKELFDKLDEYLHIYHDSLSSYIKQLGSDPSTLYTFEQLKEEWKTYAKFGMLFSLMIAKIKLLSKDDIIQMMDDNTTDDNSKAFLEATVNQDVFTKRVTDILIHGYEIGAL